MSETVDRLRAMVACECGLAGRARQQWLSVSLVPHDFPDERLVCSGCGLYAWFLVPTQPFVLTGAWDELLLACKCGENGERAKQDFQVAKVGYAAILGVSAVGVIPPAGRDGLFCHGQCGSGLWGIVPGVEAVVPGGVAVPDEIVGHAECPTCRCARAAGPVPRTARRRVLADDETTTGGA